MTCLHIYKDFELQHTINSFHLLSWTRRYNKPGEFKLVVPASQEVIAMIRSGDVCCLSGEKEGAFIQDYHTTTNIQGERKLEVRGFFLSSFFRDRNITSYKGTRLISDHLRSFISDSIINPSDNDRKMEGVRLLPFHLSKDTFLTLDYENKSLLEAIEELAKEAEAGFRIFYNLENETYDIEFFEGKETDAIFTEKYKNIITQEYYERTNHHKNVCYVKTESGVVMVGQATGFDRKETGVLAVSQSEETPFQQGLNYLKEYAEERYFDTIINAKNQQFVYKKDWDVGDIVTNQSVIYNINIKNHVLEVTEMYDKGGQVISPIFGTIR